MKKLNNNSKGFVLAETLVVTVFVMVIFTMIYSNFYPIIGEYEKRENYDDVDGEYAVYWIKKILEDPSYKINDIKYNFFNSNHYFLFSCDDISNESKRSVCNNLIKAYEVDCGSSGNACKVYVTNYTIGSNNDTSSNTFKAKVKSDNSFDSGFKDYVAYLPNYTYPSSNGAASRVIIVLHHTKDYNDYYTYATTEVNRMIRKG